MSAPPPVPPPPSAPPPPGPSELPSFSEVLSHANESVTKALSPLVDDKTAPKTGRQTVAAPEEASTNDGNNTNGNNTVVERVSKREDGARQRQRPSSVILGGAFDVNTAASTQQRQQQKTDIEDGKWHAREISTPISTSASVASPRVGAAGAVNPTNSERKARAKAAVGLRIKKITEAMVIEGLQSGCGLLTAWEDLAPPEAAGKGSCLGSSESARGGGSNGAGLAAPGTPWPKPHVKFAEVFRTLSNSEIKWFTNLLLPGMIVDAASAKLVFDTLNACANKPRSAETHRALDSAAPCARCADSCPCVDVSVWLHWTIQVEARRLLESFDPSAEDTQDASGAAAPSAFADAAAIGRSSSSSLSSSSGDAGSHDSSNGNGTQSHPSPLLAKTSAFGSRDGRAKSTLAPSSLSAPPAGKIQKSGSTSALSDLPGKDKDGGPLAPIMPIALRYRALLAMLRALDQGPYAGILQKHRGFMSTMRGLQAQLAEMPKNARTTSHKRRLFSRIIRVCADFNELRLPMPSPLHPGTVTLVELDLPRCKMLKAADNALRGLILVLAFKVSPERDPRDPPYTVVYKAGDDLRRDQMVISMMDMMGSLVRDASIAAGMEVDMKLTLYATIATDMRAGLMEFIPSSATLQSVFDVGIDKFLKAEGQPRNDGTDEAQLLQQARGNIVTSLAAYGVISYVVGMGDRHMENLMMVCTPWRPETHGRVCHIDFNRLLGDEPKGKGKQPPMRLPARLINFIDQDFVHFVFASVKFYSHLRPLHPTIKALFLSMVEAGALPDDKKTLAAIESTVNDKLRPELVGEHGKAVAANHIYEVIERSADGWKQSLIDIVHKMKN